MAGGAFSASLSESLSDPLLEELELELSELLPDDSSSLAGLGAGFFWPIWAPSPFAMSNKRVESFLAEGLAAFLSSSLSSPLLSLPDELLPEDELEDPDSDSDSSE